VAVRRRAGSDRPHDVAAEYEAKVLEVRAVRCEAPGQRGCARASARFVEGPERGRTGVFDASFSGTSSAVGVGDRVFLAKNELPPEADPQGVAPYALTGYQRHRPLLVLAAIFVAFVLVLGRWRGGMALIGLTASLLLVVKFVVPAILDGRSPILVAVVGALAVMIVLCHGLGPQSLAAIIGTTASLDITIALAALFMNLTNVSGISSEESQLVLAGRTDLSLDGLILAGMIVGALGVLDDLTVSQASTVMALRRSAPHDEWRALYRGALDVGRDHVAATVNTLVLAYVGAALPILLIFSVGATSFGDAVNIEQVAQEIVATLVGSIGLITAVPITTALAALLAPGFRRARWPPGTHTDPRASAARRHRCHLDFAPDARRPVLTTAALLLAGALAVHELRYVAAFGSHAEAALARHGHGYLALLTPALATLTALGFAAGLVRAAATPAMRSETRTRQLWPAASAALLGIYVSQELLEGVLLTGHPAGWAGVLGAGGWAAIPLAVGFGLVVALVLRAVAAVSRGLSLRAVTERLLPAPDLVEAPAAPVVARPRGRLMAEHLAGRARPAPSV
jgi:uncharacterized membrane protein